ncbi:twin-arginine translocase TatA/TatE family subunit [Kangiella sediminilitoris]|uniref:Sec-independent protein translocase protein TatA n=1 Tax=Kangiella sediminilitoris TaxID=1144748 RepID=A0A1B3B8G5_9GAMM|nr:twin-arginine translocase TatA/TatE family subunit [Kangiella sediminilitoris]AOE49070.1 Sec-independent protein translocase protein TatA [Kangiella sediminilitoris]
MKFGVWELVIILVIILLLFGTKKLRNAGGDIGSAMKNFKKAFKDEESKDNEENKEQLNDKSPKADAEFSEKKESDTNSKS